MDTLDLGTALVFSALVLITGLLFRRQSTDRNAFFAGGGAVPWWISGLSLFMSFFSVGTFVVWGSIAYSDGVVAISIQATMAVSGFLIALFIAPAWNKTNALTAAEYLTRRLGVKTQKVYSSLFLLMNVFTAGAFLYPVGKIIEVSTGIDLEIAIVVLGLFIIAYTTVGGLWAVLVTDALQFVVLTAAVIITVPLSLHAVGGMEGFINGVPEYFWDLQNEQYSWLFFIAFLFYNTAFIGGNWAYVQRYTSVKSPKDAKKVGLLFGSLYIVSPIIWMLPPMIYRVIDPGLTGSEAENSYLLMAKHVLPHGLLGLVLTSMIFATASSVNTTINIAAGVFTNDIYQRFAKSVSEKKLMYVAKLASIGFGVLAITVALSVKNMGGIVNVVLSVAAISGVPLYLPPIWAMLSRYQTSFSILFSTVVSLVINVFIKFAMPVLFGLSLQRSAEMVSGVLIPIAILTAFELYYRKTSDQPEVLTRSATASQIDDEDNPAANNQFGITVLLTGVIVIGVLISMLGLFASQSGLDKWVTLSVGGLITTAASLFLIAQKRQFNLS